MSREITQSRPPASSTMSPLTSRYLSVNTTGRIIIHSPFHSYIYIHRRVLFHLPSRNNHYISPWNPGLDVVRRRVAISNPIHPARCCPWLSVSKTQDEVSPASPDVRGPWQTRARRCGHTAGLWWPSTGSWRATLVLFMEEWLFRVAEFSGRRAAHNRELVLTRPFVVQSPT